MNGEVERKERLDELLDWACAYKGWTRKQLAAHLGRDATHLVPESGNPKSDFILALSKVLDWPVEATIECIWGDGALGRSATPAAERSRTQAGGHAPALSFWEIDALCVAAHRAGDWAKMLTAARQELAIAKDANERSVGYLREAGAWNGMGRYANEAESYRAALAESPIPAERRLLLETNLANCLLHLGRFVEARGVAADVLETIQAEKPEGESGRLAEALAYWVRGESFRMLADREATSAVAHATKARAMLTTAERLLLEMSRDQGDDSSYSGIAHTARAGLLHADAILGKVPVADAVAKVMAELDKVVDPEAVPAGDWLESYGWWCVIGSQIALHGPTGSGVRGLSADEVDRAVAICTMKGHEIADRLGNWAMRQQLFMLEHRRRQRSAGAAIGLEDEWLIDAEELRDILGSIGRFDQFRRTGWDILRSATIVGAR
jgi:hypothetical protein